MKSEALTALLLLAVVLPSAAQYRQAVPGYRYEFPRDHFNHPDYRTEWWYYTGNLRAADGHRFGFELTFFRQAIGRAPASTDTWDIPDLYLAHLALSDLDGGRFYHVERLNRPGPGIAGVSRATQRVWNGNWLVQWKDAEQQLQAVSAAFSLRLALRSNKPPVIHGRNGVSQKGEAAPNASHYISLTRLATSGSVELNGHSYAVEGTSWMDHEFFSHGLDRDQVGWDWVSLQLDDNSELMLYRLRHKDGSADPYSSGTYVDAAGRTTFLGRGEFTMTPAGETYTSPTTKAGYPIAWRVAVPSLDLDLRLKTPLAAQELAVSGSASLSYWEGAITVQGSRKGVSLGGVGYLEMTGYAAPVSLGTP